jgi:hypothetical protein
VACTAGGCSIALTLTRPSTLLAVVTLVSLPAFADEPAASVQPGVDEAKVEQPAPAAAPSRFSLRVATGIGVARGAANVSVGSGFDFHPRFNAGVEFEYSPWFDYLGGKAAPGTFNAYLTASFRWFGTPAFEVRTGILLGGSLLLFDTPGARGGSVGVILGTNVLRAAVKLSNRWWFEISPDAVLVAPSLRGVPLVYPQFRLTAAMRVML